ncbi:hypothetical protein AY599_28510 [Leptolyngbya valderiana BDU 20041]|nr:hypothetical protein AY599_28510 [Leptolyngbya valderiana BDU 20041]
MLSAAALAVGTLGGCRQEASAGSTASTSESSVAAALAAADAYRTLHDAFGDQLWHDLAEGTPEAQASLDAALADAQPKINKLIEATRAQSVDWSSHTNQGDAPAIPLHVDHMREFARLLHADARRLGTNNDHQASAERVAAAVRLCGHVGQDTTLEGLTALSLLGSTASFTLQHSQDWNPSQRTIVRTEFEAINQADPLSGSAILAAADNAPESDKANLERAQQGVIQITRKAIDALK